MANSLEAYGSVTGPAGGGSICSVNVPSPGTYEISVAVGFGGSGLVDGTDADNMQLVVDSVAAAHLAAPSAVNLASRGIPSKHIAQVSTSIAVQAIGAGTVTAVYRANITAIPVSPQQGSQAQV